MLFLYLFIQVNLTDCTKVISAETTNVSGSFFALENSNLEEQKVFTLCFRFMPYQFSTSETSVRTQFMVTLSGLKIGFENYKSGSGRNKNYVQEVRLIHNGDRDNTGIDWRMLKWNSLCIAGTGKFTNVFLNNNKVTSVGNTSMNGMIFMNDETKNNTFNGAISDVNIWKRVLNEKEILKWS